MTLAKVLIQVIKDREEASRKACWWGDLKLSPPVQSSEPKANTTYEVIKENVWKYVGTFQKHELKQGKLTWLSQKIVYQGEFKDSVYNGKGTYEHDDLENGLKIKYVDCTFKEGNPQKGTRVVYKLQEEYNDTDVPLSEYQGTFKDWKFEGFGSYKEHEKLIYKGFFKDNKFDGFGKLTFWYPKGSQDVWVMEGMFKSHSFFEGTHRILKYYPPSNDFPEERRQVYQSLQERADDINSDPVPKQQVFSQKEVQPNQDEPSPAFSYLNTERSRDNETFPLSIGISLVIV